MSPDVFGLVLGAVFIVPTLYFVRHKSWDQVAWPLFLVTLPVYYMLFGLLAGDSKLVLLELVYGLPFVVLGMVCFRLRGIWMVYLLAFGWLAHGVYDYAHDQLFVNPGVFSWYPSFCALIDVLVAVYLVVQGRTILQERDIVSVSRLS